MGSAYSSLHPSDSRAVGRDHRRPTPPAQVHTEALPAPASRVPGVYQAGDDGTSGREPGCPWARRAGGGGILRTRRGHPARPHGLGSARSFKFPDELGV